MLQNILIAIFLIASHRPVFYVHVWMNFLIILLKYPVLFRSSRRIPFYIMVGLQPLTTIPAINQPVMTNVVFSSSPVLTSHNQGQYETAIKRTQKTGSLFKDRKKKLITVEMSHIVGKHQKALFRHVLFWNFQFVLLQPVALHSRLQYRHRFHLPLMEYHIQGIPI